ncbi:deazaflavin-dependent oxidoreductase (nitroreductase family) [Prauserella sediminis]|uniref:Deazaflavin-dependent oxidoreductase (Nitroreductase family) n=1 Tax=Prauserella sediminis TaxID=577680 RepID=A0A839XR10_9PSEU|nr:nitroreductase/quinone reductase family protein [Prauserella sediminis]MBB3665137.1 deazaflavin-dependent oxidoreductase (nitroreductase family) [Prauserella sediminis]
MCARDSRSAGKFRVVNRLHRMVNPVMRRIVGRMPGQALLETTGHRTGRVRHTPIGGAIRDGRFWFVSDHGEASAYVRNLMAEPRVRVRQRGVWYSGTAHVLPDDDARARLRTLPRLNGVMIRALGTNLTTIRIDLDD